MYAGYSADSTPPSKLTALRGLTSISISLQPRQISLNPDKSTDFRAKRSTISVG